MSNKTVLIECEESQAVTMAFRELGIQAYSCDLLPCSGGHPEWHLQGDVRVIRQGGRYDLKISFPPCTDLAVSGARWFKEKRQNDSQRQSIEFFLNCWLNADAVENPIGIMNNGNYIKTHFPKLYDYAKLIKFPFKPTQIIQPWMFGHKETKATCLWLKGLPLLKETNNVKVWMDMEPDSVKHRIHRMSPGPDRARLRSKTYSGIAKGMAAQWSAAL